MIRRLVRIALWSIGTVIAVALILFTLLIVDWSRSSKRTEQDRIIQQRPSPDGKLIAEIHTFTTAMWGGPDTLYLSIRPAQSASGSTVYSRTYECADYSAFGLEWNTLKDLTLKYGECHSSKFDSPTEFAQENKISKSDSAWNDVMIHYVDSRHVASR
jgi:hypothetical protein